MSSLQATLIPDVQKWLIRAIWRITKSHQSIRHPVQVKDKNVGVSIRLPFYMYVHLPHTQSTQCRVFVETQPSCAGDFRKSFESILREMIEKLEAQSRSIE